MMHSSTPLTTFLIFLAVAPSTGPTGSLAVGVPGGQYFGKAAGSALVASFHNIASSVWRFDEPSQSAAYQEGKKRLDEGRWHEAAEIFHRLAEEGKAGSAGAMYWAAYARSKMFEYAEALNIIKRLKQTHPSSSWLDDAKALAIEIRAKSGQVPDQGLNPEDELKLLALGSLSQVNPERAMALLKRFVKEDHSFELKKKALFVLTQMNSEEKLPYLEGLLEDNQYRELHGHIINYLGMMGGEESWVKLLSLYRSSDNLDRKVAILQSLMVGNRPDLLSDLMENETNEHLKLEMIQKLGLLGDTKRLDTLMSRTTNREEKLAILHAYFLSGNAPALLKAIREDGDQEYQARAIELLGMTGQGEHLEQLYDSVAEALKPQVLHALFLGNQMEVLERIAREDPKPEYRKQAMHSLAMTGRKDGAFWVATYGEHNDQELREIALLALRINQDGAALVQLARQETDMEAKKEIVRLLSQIHSEETQAYLLELIEN